MLVCRVCRFCCAAGAGAAATARVCRVGGPLIDMKEKRISNLSGLYATIYMMESTEGKMGKNATAFWEKANLLSEGTGNESFERCYGPLASLIGEC